MSFAYHSTLQINEPNSSLSSKDKKHNTAFVILVKKKLIFFGDFVRLEHALTKVLIEKWFSSKIIAHFWFSKKKILIKSCILNNFYSYLPFCPLFCFSKIFRVIVTYFYKGCAINLAYSTLDWSTYPLTSTLHERKKTKDLSKVFLHHAEKKNI